jgi:hypothetical protein
MYLWQQKMNYEENWETVGEYKTKESAEKDKAGFKTHGIARSGRTGLSFVQQRIITNE